jgi:DNA-binding response OmpR family regulator
MKKICLIEDTPDLLSSLTEFLEMEGFIVWPHRGGVDALKRLRSDVPDIILTDLRMAGMDGLELIRNLKEIEHLKDIPVIIFSAQPLQEYEVEARQLGVDHYIKKPASLDEILDIVNRSIQ